MGAAAELHAEVSYLDDPYLLAVLFLEQRCGAFPDGIFTALFFGVDVDACHDLLVDDVLDLRYLHIVHTFKVGKVKPQPVLFYKGAGLFYMISKDLSQGVVKQVRRGMVP